MFNKIINFIKVKIFKKRTFCAGCYWYRGQSKGVMHACVHKSNLTTIKTIDTWFSRGIKIKCNREALDINNNNDCLNVKYAPKRK